MRNVLSVLSFGVLLTLVSCHRDNPKPVDLPSVQFDASITEQRDSKNFNWQVVEMPGGGWTTCHSEYLDFDEEDPQTGEKGVPFVTTQSLVVTAYNSVTLYSTADVNVESSNPGAVSVSRVSEGNSRSFLLAYRGEGVSTIRMWNGSGENLNEKSFLVLGQEFVDVVGLRFTFGGEPLVVRHVSSSRPKMFACDADWAHEDESGWSFATRPTKCDFQWLQYKKPNVWVPDSDRPGYGEFVIDPTQGAPLRFEGFEPENASFRKIIDFESEWDYVWNKTSSNIADGHHGSDEYNNWPNETNVNQDVSFFEGRGIWIDGVGITYIASIKVEVANGDYKYLILYYGKNDEL
jgi:hypothetical protein